MKKLLAKFLSGAMIISIIPVQLGVPFAYAATENATAIMAEEPVSLTEPTDQGLEKAITKVKQKITVPAEYSEFEYYYYDSGAYTGPIWNMSWENPTTNSRIMINCDKDYHITYYNIYNYDEKTSGVTKYLKNELKATADEFIKKIAPETNGNLEYISADYDGIYSGNYVYSYKRKANGVDLPDNMVTVSVSSVTGKVTSASINWIYDTTIPNSSVKITKDEATALIKENTKMKLVYKSDYYHIYDKSNIATAKKAFLVYEPVDSYISIDAKTGEVYKTRSEWIDTSKNNGAAMEDSTADAGAGQNIALTEEEIKKVNELKNLISKSKAIETITKNPYLYLDKNLKAYSATLNKQDKGSGKTSYIWNISLRDPREVDYENSTDYYRAYAYATVDAETGKILSFYTTLNDNYDEVKNQWKKVDIKYDREEAQKLLVKFFKTQIQDRYNNSVLVSQSDDYVAYYNEKEPVYGGYAYQYSRVNEKVEYPDNFIYGSVDGVTGKIYSYGSYWDENITFESAKGVITADKAMDYYLNNEDYGLKYEINVINKYDSGYGDGKELYDYTQAYSAEYKVRLVYRPDIYPSYISPFTGERLNYNGEVYTETPPYTYKDVQNTESNRNILLLSDMNIGFEGEYFLPEKEITIGEMTELLSEVGYYNSETTVNADKTITREEMAQLLISRIGLGKVAKLQGIYKTGFTDENNIGLDYLGAVALAKGLGIMSGDSNNNFNPSKKITRSEAVNLLINFISVSKNGIYD